MPSTAMIRRVTMVTAAAASLAACASVERGPAPGARLEAESTPAPRTHSRKPSGRNDQSAQNGGRRVGKPYQINGVWYVPLRVPVIEPSAATLAVPVATSATPFAVVISLNEKFEKVTVWPETVPVTVTEFRITCANSCTWTAAPV